MEYSFESERGTKRVAREEIPMTVRFEIECGRCIRKCSVRINETEEGVLEASGYGCSRGLDVANIEANRKRHKIISHVQVAGTDQMLRVGLTRKVYDEESPRVMEEILAYVAQPPIARKQVLIQGIGDTMADLVALESFKLKA